MTYTGHDGREYEDLEAATMRADALAELREEMRESEKDEMTTKERRTLDRQAPIAPARDLETYAASERFQTYVFEVSVQCRARACTFIHYVGDRFAHVRIAEDQARRHVAETGHEVEVLTHRVTAYRPRKER